MERIKQVNSVMVTGSCGFVGNRIVRRIREHGVEVIEVDIKNGRDISDFRVLLDLQDVDVVVHLAARMSTTDAFDKPADIYNSNLNGTVNILEYCRQRAVKKIIYTSSYIYGLPEYLPIDEKHKTKIQNPYGRSKLIGEILSVAYFDDYGVLPIIFRPFNIYGPGQSENFLIPCIMKQVLKVDGEIKVKDLFPRRDFIYIDDVIDAYLYAIFNYECAAPEIFNIGYGESYSVKEIIKKIQEIAGTQKKIIATRESRKNEIPDCIADTTKIKRNFNWIPQYDIDKGLRETFLFYKYHV